MIDDASTIAKEFAVKFRYRKLSPSEPSKRSLCMGFKCTNLAKNVVGQLLASNEWRKPPHWTNVAFVSLYEESVSKLMSKVGLVYHESLCSRQLITEAIPPRTQSNPFTSTLTSLELHLPTTIDTQNLYCPIHMLPTPPCSDSINFKGKHVTSKDELTAFPNSLDGNLDSSGIETLDKLTNPGEFIIDDLRDTAQELRYSSNQDSFPFNVQLFSLKTYSTSRANGLCGRILPNEYDQCFFDDTNFGGSTDGGGIILQDQECLTFSLNSITDRFSAKLPGVGLSSFNIDFGFYEKPDLNLPSNLRKGYPCPDKPRTNTISRVRSADVGSGNLLVPSHSQTLDGIRVDCAPSIDQARPNLSKPVGTNLTQTSVLNPHGSNLSQSTIEALLEIMGGDSDDSKPPATIPSKPPVPNLVPHPESPFNSKDSNSDGSLPLPRFPAKPLAQIQNQPTKVPVSCTFQSPASAPNLVVPEPAIRQSASTSLIQSIAFLLNKSCDIEKTEMKQVLENIVIGDQPVSNQEAPNLSKAVRALFNNHKGLMMPTALNVIVDLFNHQNPKLVKIEELRALLFVLDIHYKSTMNESCLRELLSDTLSQKWFSEVVHRLEANITRGKFKISDNPSYVREAIIGSKLKNPSDYINLYCKTQEVEDKSFCLDCLGQFSSLEKKRFWEERARMVIKRQIEQDNAYAELYCLKEESSTPKKIGCGVKKGFDSDTDSENDANSWERPPPTPEPGMDLPPSNVLMIIHPQDPDIRIPIYDCIIDWKPPKPERIKAGRLDFSLMSMVGKVAKNYFQDLEESMNDKWYGPFLTTILPSSIKSHLCIDNIPKHRFKIDSHTFYNKVDLYEYKQGLVVVDKSVLQLGTSINGDRRLESRNHAVKDIQTD
eukprot:jgi/Psemu1/39353/gm1.39353_g